VRLLEVASPRFFVSEHFHVNSVLPKNFPEVGKEVFTISAATEDVLPAHVAEIHRMIHGAQIFNAHFARRKRRPSHLAKSVNSED
jgi:hypothetical protein